MSPETVKKLQENVPELRELIAFLSAGAEKLNTLADIQLITAHDLAVEVMARKHAYKTITDMLAPLLDVQDTDVVTDSNEYVV